jgi:hypothetical protein
MKGSRGNEAVKVVVIEAVIFVVSAFGIIMWCRHLLRTAIRP